MWACYHNKADEASGEEVLVVFNTRGAARNGNSAFGFDARSVTALAGPCPAAVSALGSAKIRLPALGYAVCKLEPSAP